MSTGAPKGNRNAFKNGQYTAEALAKKQKIRDLIKETRNLLREME